MPTPTRRGSNYRSALAAELTRRLTAAMSARASARAGRRGRGARAARRPHRRAGRPARRARRRGSKTRDAVQTVTLFALRAVGVVGRARARPGGADADAGAAERSRSADAVSHSLAATRLVIEAAGGLTKQWRDAGAIAAFGDFWRGHESQQAQHPEARRCGRGRGLHAVRLRACTGDDHRQDRASRGADPAAPQGAGAGRRAGEGAHQGRGRDCSCIPLRSSAMRGR